MKFRYRSLPASNPTPYLGTKFIRPIVSITLKSGGKEIRYAALVDSGADFCIFDAEIGEAIGLDIRTGAEVSFGGIQDRTVAVGYFHHIRLGIGGW